MNAGEGPAAASGRELVSVVIPTHERRDALARALDSLSGQSLAAGEYEVVVAVDGSRDGTLELLERFAGGYRLVVVSGPRRGRAAACNAAFAAVSGQIVVVLDDDMRVVPDFVERHRAHHPPGTRRCVLGAVPVALEAGSTHAAAYVGAKFQAHLERLGEPDHHYVPRDFYSGNCSLRTELLREVGGFDPAFTRYGNEDVELALRLRAAGAELCFDPLARAEQEYGKDLWGLLEDTYAKGTTTVLLARLHPDVFGALRLAAPDDASRPWLAARALLLSLTGSLPVMRRLCFQACALLERAGCWRSPLFYRAALDFAFWSGVDEALGSGGQGDDAELRALARHLRAPWALRGRRPHADEGGHMHTRRD